MLLISEDIVLRAIEHTDADFLRGMINDPEMEYLVLGWSPPISKHRQLEWIDSLKPDELKFVIEVGNTAVGMASITGLNYKDSIAAINIKIGRKDHRGKGIGSKTIDLLSRYCFDELNLNCLVARVLEHNTGSRRLFEKCGFVPEGVLRQRVYKRGRYHNVISYSLLRREYNA